MTIGLVMIVKDEAPILPRLADSVREHIDHWTLVDTGSTDETVNVAYDVFKPVPGTICYHPFDGFGPSRTFALREAEKHTDWMLCLCADETLHGHIEVYDHADIIEAEQHNGDMRFWLPRLLKSGRGWESRGRSHEYYWSPIGSGTWPARTDAFYVEHHGDGHDRPNKFTRDIDLLLADWADDSGNPSSAWACACSTWGRCTRALASCGQLGLTSQGERSRWWRSRSITDSMSSGSWPGSAPTWARSITTARAAGCSWTPPWNGGSPTRSPSVPGTPATKTGAGPRLTGCCATPTSRSRSTPRSVPTWSSTRRDRCGDGAVDAGLVVRPQDYQRNPSQKG